MVNPIRNWRNETTRSENQRKIVEAIYEDELFEFMTYKELLESTGLKKPTLSHHLRELCQEGERAGNLYLELGEITSKHPELMHSKPDEPLPIRRLLTSPMLMTKRGVYKLHPDTKWALDRGIYPEIVKDRDLAKQRIRERQQGRLKRLQPETEVES